MVHRLYTDIKCSRVLSASVHSQKSYSGFNFVRHDTQMKSVASFAYGLILIFMTLHVVIDRHVSKNVDVAHFRFRFRENWTSVFVECGGC